MHRIIATACISLGVAVATHAQAKVSLDTVLERFGIYLTTYYQAYAATIATEHYATRNPLSFAWIRMESPPAKQILPAVLA